MKKNIIFFAEKQYLRFYTPLAKKLYKQNFHPILILVDTLEEKQTVWPYEYVHIPTLLKKIDFTNLPNLPSLEELTLFEQKFLEQVSLFEKSYVYTVDNVKSLDDAKNLAKAWFVITIEAIKLWKPLGIFLWNGRLLPYKAIAEACKKTNYPFYTNEIGWIPGTIFIDKGPLTNHTNSLEKEIYSQIVCSDKTKEHSENFLQDYTQSEATMVEQKTEDPVLLRKRLLEDKELLLFYGCQVDWDTNIVIGSSKFSTNAKAISFLVKALKKFPQIKLIVKPHPLDTIDQTKEIVKALGKYGEIVTNIHAHSLIKATDCTIIRNSTLGFEALCYKKPLIALEKAKYSTPKLIYSPKNTADLENIFEQLIQNTSPILPDEKTLEQFINHILIDYLLPIPYNYFYSKKSLGLLSHFKNNLVLKKLYKQLNKTDILIQISNAPDHPYIKELLSTNIKRDGIIINKIKTNIKNRIKHLLRS